MSTDHRKPLVVFMLLAVAAVVLVVQRADADAGRWFDVAGGALARVHGAALRGAPDSAAAGPAAGLRPRLGAAVAPRPNVVGSPAGGRAGSAGSGGRAHSAVSRDEERRALRSRDAGETLRRGDSDAGAHHDHGLRGGLALGHADRRHTHGRATTGSGRQGRHLQRGADQTVKHED